MAEQCYNLVDGLHLLDTFEPMSQAWWVDRVATAEAYKTGRGSRLPADALTLSESYVAVAVSLMRDALTLGEQYRPETGGAVVLSDTLTAADRFAIRRSVRLADALAAADVMAASRIAYLADAPLHAGDGAVPLGGPTQRIADALRVADRWVGIRLSRFADALAAGEAWSFARVQALPADALHVSGAFVPQRTLHGGLSDALRLGDGGTAYQSHAARLAETVWVDEYYAPPEDADAATAWTANTDTFAMSRYTGARMTGVAAFGGALYGIDPAGLWRLDGDTDDGAPIAANVTTGLDSLGNENLKHPRALYAWATFSNPRSLTTTVRAITAGWKSPPLTYRFEARRGYDYACTRALLGRGMRSRYFQFTVGNLDGEAFTLDRLAVAADTNSRRL